MNKKTLPIIAILLIIVAFLAGLKLTQKKLPAGGGVSPTPSAGGVQPTEAPKYPTTFGNFSITNQEICKENAKPVIYYFGSTSCPHCSWEEPIVKKVAEKFSGLISFHNNMDKQTDMEVFQKYADINPGYIPFLVFGCKYARLGSGETDGEAKEVENLSIILCKLTDGKPVSVCEPLKGKAAEVK